MLKKLQYVPIRDDGISDLSAVVTLKERAVSQVSFKHPKFVEPDWNKTKTLYEEVRRARKDSSIFSPGLRSQNS